jgi:hypothetical protein
MEQRELSYDQQAAVILRCCAGASALLTVLGWIGLLSTLSDKETAVSYDIVIVVLSLGIFTLTFERRFAEYWQIVAALFFSASVVIWAAIGLTLDTPIPVIMLIGLIPPVTVLLPWGWQFQLGIGSLCVGAALLAAQKWPAAAQSNLLWVIAAGESAVAVLASWQLQRQRAELND